MTILALVSLTLFVLLCLSIRQNLRLSYANRELDANIELVKQTGMTWFKNEAKGIAECEAAQIAAAFTRDPGEQRKLGVILTDRIMLAMFCYFVTSGRQNRLMREAEQTTPEPAAVAGGAT